MRRAAILILLISFSACSNFSKLSRYEKRWAFAHPVAALKARQLSGEILKTYNEVKASPLAPDNYENGGKLDAFRHVFAMAVLSSRIHAKKIKRLGEAHEKGNYRDFRKSRAEEGELPDSIGTVMDLRNNDLGISIGKRIRGKKLSMTEIKHEVLNEIRLGNAFYVRRSTSDAYVDCLNKPIDMEKWKGKWAIPKCLISTKE